MKVSILLGSVRRGRHSDKAARFLEKKLRERNVKTDLIDLAATPLPIFDGQEQDAAAVDNISRRLNEADALIFVTPEYQGSFSGALKNALDYFWSEFKRKPIGVAAVSSGRMGGINAASQLQHVVLSLGGYPLPKKWLVPEVQLAFDHSYAPRDEKITRGVERFLEEFLWFARAIAGAKGAADVQAA